jgi:hypothetical protein
LVAGFPPITSGGGVNAVQRLNEYKVLQPSGVMHLYLIAVPEGQELLGYSSSPLPSAQ